MVVLGAIGLSGVDVLAGFAVCLQEASPASKITMLKMLSERSAKAWHRKVCFLLVRIDRLCFIFALCLSAESGE